MRQLVLVLVIVAAGCVRNVEPRAAAGTCDGTRYALVSNEWNRPVEVYVYDTPGPRTRVGTVLANTQDEFRLPPRATVSLVSEVDSGQRRVHGLAAELHGVPVSLSYACR